jgi:hypothetical protein
MDPEYLKRMQKFARYHPIYGVEDNCPVDSNHKIFAVVPKDGRSQFRFCCDCADVVGHCNPAELWKQNSPIVRLMHKIPLEELPNFARVELDECRVYVATRIPTPFSNKTFENIPADGFRHFLENFHEAVQTKLDQENADTYRVVPHEEVLRWTKKRWHNKPRNWHIWTIFKGFGSRVLAQSLLGQYPEEFKNTPWSYYGYLEPEDPEDNHRDELASSSKRFKSNSCGATTSQMEDERFHDEIASESKRLKTGADPRDEPTWMVMTAPGWCITTGPNTSGRVFHDTRDAAASLLAPKCVRDGGSGRMMSVFDPKIMVRCALHECLAGSCPSDDPFDDLMCDESPNQEDLDLLPQCSRISGYGRIMTIGEPDKIVKCSVHGCFVKDCPLD